MKKVRFFKRLIASLLFLALLVCAFLAFFSATGRLVFIRKHSEILGLTANEYQTTLKDIRDERVRAGLDADATEDDAEKAARADALTREQLRARAMVDVNNITVQMKNEITNKALEFTGTAGSYFLLEYRTLFMVLCVVIMLVSLYGLSKLGEFSRHYLLMFLLIIWLIPIVWLILCAFSTDRGPNISRFFPEGYSLTNFKELLVSTDDVAQYPNWFKNSFIVAVFNCIISSSFVLMVAYSMSCMRFKARKPMMNVAIILNLFPGFLTMIAVYFVMKQVGLTNSNIGLIIVYSAGSGLGYLVAKGFFDTVPKSLREAAMIEGANEAVVFWKIVVPLSKPIIVYTVIGAFLSPWADFVFANVMINDGISAHKTVAMGLYAMVNKVNINEYFGRFCAGGVLVSIPISVLFVIMQKCYIEGVTGGSVKG